METLTIAQLIKKIEELDAHCEKAGMKRESSIEFKYGHNAKYSACFTIYSPWDEDGEKEWE